MRDTRTKKETRASFSDNTLNFTLPAKWLELSDRELRGVIAVLSSHEWVNARTRCFFFLAGLRMIRTIERGERCVVEIGCSDGPRIARLSVDMLRAASESLDWLKDPGDEPVRIESLGKHNALDRKFHGVPFKTWLMAENLYQGYLQSKNAKALSSLAKVLYPGFEGDLDDKAWQFGVLMWMVQLKAQFANTFTNLYKPASGSGEPASQRERMDSMIRALSGGDITKESQVLEADTWRALTELDAKAKEADELRKIYNKK